MKCGVCGAPHPPHELARGRCLRCCDRVLTEALKGLMARSDVLRCPSEWHRCNDAAKAALADATEPPKEV